MVYESPGVEEAVLYAFRRFRTCLHCLEMFRLWLECSGSFRSTESGVWGSGELKVVHGQSGEEFEVCLWCPELPGVSLKCLGVVL